MKLKINEIKSIKIKLTTQPNPATSVFLFFFSGRKKNIVAERCHTANGCQTNALQSPFQDSNMADAAWKKLKIK